MKKRILMLASLVGSSVLSHAGLTNRYVFDSTVDDTVGSLNGTATAATVNLEVPLYVADVPANPVVGAPTQSLQVGMNFGSKSSGFWTSPAVISTGTGSYSMWVKADILTSQRYLFAALPLPNGPTLKGSNIAGDLTVLAGDPVQASVDAPFTTGAWHHVVATWDNPNGTLSLYVDGTLIGTDSFTANSMSPTTARFGNFSLSDGSGNWANQFQGSFYDVQFYDHALAAGDVSDLYAGPGSTYTPPAAVLAHRYIFNNDAADVVGGVNGIPTTAGDTTEAPGYEIVVAPAGAVAGAPTTALHVGENRGTLASNVNIPGSVVNATAGSYSVWLKPDTLNGADYIVALNGARLMSPNSTTLRCIYNGFTQMAETTVTAGAWIHAVVTWDAASHTMTYYVNGSLVGRKTDAGVPSDSIRLGNLNNVAANQYDGLFYDFQAYDGVLSGEDVTTLYSYPGSSIGAEVVSDTSPVLQHRYTFDNDFNDVVGSLTGTPTLDGGANDTESPDFVGDTPSGLVAGAPAGSAEFGMSNADPITPLKSAISLNQAVIDSVGSISFWMNPDSLANGDYIVHSPGALTVLGNSSDQIRFKNDTLILGDATVQTGAWSHVVVTWSDDTDTFYCFVNGALVLSSTSSTSPFSATYDVRIGNFNAADDSGNITNNFDGTLYDLQFYSGELGSDDVFELFVNPGSAIWSELPAFPALADYASGPNLIPNGEFDSVTGNVDNPSTSSNLWYETGSFGDLWGWSEGFADLDDWSFYYEDPSNITPLVGTPNADDSATADTLHPLDGSTLLDTWLNGAGIILTSASSYRNGLKSEDILNGVTIDPAANYAFEISVSSAADNMLLAKLTTALTDGTNETNTVNAIDGSLMEIPLDDVYSATAAYTTYAVEVSGADLDNALQVNVLFDLQNTDPIPGVAEYLLDNEDSVAIADIKANYREASLSAKIFIDSVSLVEKLVPEHGDFNRDGAVDQLDVDLMNSYLDGGVDGGANATTRQDYLIAQGMTPAEALAYLGLSEFDLDGDNYFSGSDETAMGLVLLEDVAVGSIEMDGSGDVIIQLNGLAPGKPYYLKRAVDLSGGFGQIDTVTPSSDTATFTDEEAPADQAFYQVTD